MRYVRPATFGWGLLRGPAGRLAYEVGYNTGAQASLDALVDTLVTLADTPAIAAMGGPDALRVIAQSLEDGGVVELVLPANPEGA